MTIHVENEEAGRPRVDLSGQAGNAYVLLGHATTWAKQLGWEKPAIDALLVSMKQKDYTHLVSVLEKTFGEYVDLVMAPELASAVQNYLEAQDTQPATPSLAPEKKEGATSSKEETVQEASTEAPARKRASRSRKA